MKAESGEIPGGCRATGRESEQVFFNQDLPLRTDVIVVLLSQRVDLKKY